MTFIETCAYCKLGTSAEQPTNLTPYFMRDIMQSSFSLRCHLLAMLKQHSEPLARSVSFPLAILADADRAN
jgi:hypothetical protein